MINIRKVEDDSKEHPDFIIRHAHLSRTNETQLEVLRNSSDFCLSQIGCRVQGVSINKGSQYFIEDQTLDKSVKCVFEQADLSEFNIGVHKGLTSFSRADIVKVYNNNKGAK